MVEAGNRLLEEVLRKGTGDWEEGFPQFVRSLNSRIIKHLNMAPCEILMGVPPAPSLSSIDPQLLSASSLSVCEWVEQMDNDAQHAAVVQQYKIYRAETHDRISQLSAKKKEEEAIRYNRGVRVALFTTGTLVMLYQKDTGKLQPRWRGPFQIHGFSSDRKITYTLVQLNGKKIRGTFHGDHLKQFVPREGHLASSQEYRPPGNQALRQPRGKKKK